MLHLALYKGRKRIFDRLIQWWTKGPYSHSEVVFDYNVFTKWGYGGSASFLDRGVRVKQIWFNTEKWDIIELDGYDEEYAKSWYKQQYGRRYDLLGLLSLAAPIPEHKRRYWCTEANAASLKMVDPWRYHPNNILAAVQGRFIGSNN